MLSQARDENVNPNMLRLTCWCQMLYSGDPALSTHILFNNGHMLQLKSETIAIFRQMNMAFSQMWPKFLTFVLIEE